MPDATSPKTLLDAVRHFSDLGVCHAHMIRLKWPDGRIVCPKCGGDKVGAIASRRMMQCKAKECRKQFSAKVGTIFEDSPLPLSSWFVAVWAIANAKNGISSCELARALGVTQKTAWFMLHRIRLAMKTETFRKLTGEVEIDETFIGGKAKNMHKSRREKVIQGRGAVGKTVVLGALERGNAAEKKPSQVVATVVPSTDAQSLIPEIVRTVDKSATVYTDASQSYSALALTHLREFIDHATTYVSGRVHINGLENFWSCLKRTLKGTYIRATPFHLFRYLDEQVFRFNHRKKDDAGRFDLVMKTVLGRRLTFRELCAIDGAGFMGIA